MLERSRGTSSTSDLSGLGTRATGATHTTCWSSAKYFVSCLDTWCSMSTKCPVRRAHEESVVRGHPDRVGDDAMGGVAANQCRPDEAQHHGGQADRVQRQAEVLASENEEDA